MKSSEMEGMMSDMEHIDDVPSMNASFWVDTLTKDCYKPLHPI